MLIQNKLQSILNKTTSIPNLESALSGFGILHYTWFRFKYFILSSFLFYLMFFIKMYYLGAEYTSFYTTKILVFEQFVFWFAQIFWYLIILMQKNQNLLPLKIRLDPKITFTYSVMVSLVIGYFLYRNGLVVFERFTVY